MEFFSDTGDWLHGKQLYEKPVYRLSAETTNLRFRILLVRRELQQGELQLQGYSTRFSPRTWKSPLTAAIAEAVLSSFQKLRFPLHNDPIRKETLTA